MIPIIRQEVRRRRASMIWWSLGIAAFLALNLLIYPSIKQQSAELNQSLASLPNSVRAFFSETGDFVSPVGYLSSKTFYFIMPLLMSILGIGLGTSLIGKEEQQHTLELLLARPISRGRLLAAKALAGFLVLGGIWLVSTIVTVICAHYGQFGLAGVRIVAASLLTLLISSLAGAIAFALTACGGKLRSAAMPVASIVVLGGYVIASFEKTVHWLSYVSKVFPYHYYKPAEALEGHMSWGAVVGMLCTMAILGVIAWMVFRRRDID